MKDDQIVHLETWIGWLFIASWGLWYFSHRHQPANRTTDYFAGLAALGALILLHAWWKKIRLQQLK